MKKKAILFIITITILSLACKKNFYEKYYSFKNNVWDYHDTAIFKVHISPEDTSDLNIYFNIRHHTLYPYKNLWLFVNISGPENISETDTINIFLADDKGNFKGEGLGDIWDYKYLFRNNVKFKLPGDYTFKITHGMRDADKIPVMELGLIIEKNN